MKNNRNKGNIIINNKKYPLKSVISINNLKKSKIKMIINKNIYNKSCMFKNCKLLESLSRIFINQDEKEEPNQEKINFDLEAIKNKVECYLFNNIEDSDESSTFFYDKKSF